MSFNLLERINYTLTIMTIVFNKYQGTGNDFIIIDNRKAHFNPDDNDLVRRLCDRRFGIGADGLILISDNQDYDFEMKYYNADGFESTMCGNGGRCSAAFAIRHKLAGKNMTFKAIDGIHNAFLEDNIIRLQMNDVPLPEKKGDNYFLNTGSPHCVVFTKNAEQTDVEAEGKRIRWSDTYAPQGTNVNFVEIQKSEIYVRTFERGVEGETLSCGTGVTASAITSFVSRQIDIMPVKVRTKGGELSVSFKTGVAGVTDIWLSGPATFVFEGAVKLNSLELNNQYYFTIQ